MLRIYYIQIYIVKLWTIWKFLNRQVPDRRLQTRSPTMFCQFAYSKSSLTMIEIQMSQPITDLDKILGGYRLMVLNVIILVLLVEEIGVLGEIH